MFNQCTCMRNSVSSTLCTALTAVVMSIGISPAAAQDCQAALGSSTGAVTLTNGNTTSQTKGVDEWDGDVLKLHTPFPGVIVLEGIGSGSQSSLYTEGSTSFHPLVDSANLGTGLGDLQVVVPAGDHCIQVAPGPGATGNFEVEVSFTDACHLGDTDDHGDSFLCATSIDIDDSDSGEIDASADADLFTFVLTSAATVAIESTGSTDVAGGLYDNDGALLEEDDHGGTSPNFLIARSLDAGRYYVKISGVNDDGAYGLSVSLVP